MNLWINICFHIWHAAIAYLYGISVKYFMKLLAWCKMFIWSGQKLFSNFYDNVSSVWWIQPYSIPFLVFGGGGILSYVLLVSHLMFISCFFIASLYIWNEFLNISSLPNNHIDLLLFILAAVWLWRGND